MNAALRSLIITLAIFSNSNSNELDNKRKNDFLIFFSSWSDDYKDHPDKKNIDAFFFDLNQDGTPEAFATCFGRSHETFASWIAFKQTDSGWKPIPSINPQTNERMDMNAIHAAADEYYSLKSKDKTILVVIHKDQTPPKYGNRKPVKIEKIGISDQGLLISEKITDLEQIIAYSPAFSNIERLAIESQAPDSSR